MPRPSALAVRRPPAPVGWQSWASLAVCGTLLLWPPLAGGILCLWVHASAPTRSTCWPLPGSHCWSAPPLQLRCNGMGIRSRRIFTDQAPVRQLGFWRRLFVGAFFAYLAALSSARSQYIGLRLAGRR